jgi:hypothetical protein
LTGLQDQLMFSTDVYRTKLLTTFEQLKALAQPLTGVALVDHVATPDFIKLALVPNVANACPVELMLRTDQLYDIAVGTEFYEDCPVDTFDDFAPLVRAIIEGNVTQRRHTSRATNTERAIETIVQLPNGTVWRKGHVHGDAGPVIAEADTLISTRNFVPYLRPD